MFNISPLSYWHRFLALPNGSRTKTLGIAFLVSLVSATAVSITSVVLKPRQQAHIVAAREANLAAMIAALPGLAEVLRETGAETLESKIIDLATGQIVHNIDPASFDFIATQADPAQSTVLLPEDDIAGIARRPNRAPVYLLHGVEGLELVVLPIYGTGYQSTIRAYLALKNDLNTIAALSVYEQAETPGIGTRIADPAWLTLWSDRLIKNSANEIVITVVPGSAASMSEIDGITGATRSTTGVTNLVQFWLGEKGFGPFLNRLKIGAS